MLAHGNLATPSEFNLLLLYQPPDGGVGIQTPVVVEQFNNLTLATVSSTFSAQSTLLTVLTFEGEPNPSLSAYDLMNFNASDAVPFITLNDGANKWTPVPNLLASGPEDKNFVVEVEYNGNAYLRFGDDTYGMSPVAETAFTASYRIGNGTAGNVGAGSLVFMAADPRIQTCTNPLPAIGGVDPETMAQIRRRAPQAFLSQERAITMTDYANVTEQNPQVEDAVANLRWTGSWYTVFVTAEPLNGGSLNKPLQRTLTQYVNRYRLAGQDLKLEGPDYVSLEITLTVCVDPDYFQADVEKGPDAGSWQRHIAQRQARGLCSRQLQAWPDRLSQPYLRRSANSHRGAVRDRHRLSAARRQDQSVSPRRRDTHGPISGGTHGQRSQPSGKRPANPHHDGRKVRSR